MHWIFLLLVFFLPFSLSAESGLVLSGSGVVSNIPLIQSGSLTDTSTGELLPLPTTQSGSVLLETLDESADTQTGLIIVLPEEEPEIFVLSPPYQRIVISEVLWAGSHASTADEWFELKSLEIEPVSLIGWYITYMSNGEEKEMVRFDEVTIQPDDWFLVANYGPENEKSVLSVQPDVVTTSVSLPNTKLLLRLYDSYDRLIDTVDDGIGVPFAGLNQSGTGTKASMVRIDLTGSGSIKENWKTATASVGFDDDVPVLGTPGSGVVSFDDALVGSGEIANVSELATSSGVLASQSGIVASSSGSTVTASGSNLIEIEPTTEASEIVHPKVYMTEVLSNPIGKDDEEWIEVGNLGSGTVNIAGWVLDEGNSPGDYNIEPRSESGFWLSPGEHVLFPKSVSQLPLGNKGERLTLYSGSFLIDTWAYSETAEHVSFGRTPMIDIAASSGALLQFTPMCQPTPAAPNTLDPPNVEIVIQSGNPTGEQNVSVNLEAAIASGSLQSATCKWDYGNGFTSESCNPPSHTFREVGEYRVSLSVETFCGQIVERTLPIVVRAKPSAGAGGGSISVSSNDTPSQPEPVCELSPYAELVRISEFLPNPFGNETEGEWVELYNPFPAEVNLCGLWLDDNEGGSKPFSLDSYTIAAESYLVIPRKESKIALNNSDEEVRLYKKLVHENHVMDVNLHFIDSVSYPKAPEGETMALRSDNLHVWTIFPTPGAVNRFRTAERRYDHQQVVVSSALPNPAGRDTEGEWIELTNVSDTTVDVSGWFLDNREGASAPFLLSNVVLHPGQVRRFSIQETGITLANKADVARLLDPDRFVASILSWTEAVDSRIYYPPVFSDKRFPATVSAVVDGDTLDVVFDDTSILEDLPDSLRRRWRSLLEGGESSVRVRLIGIDTPETVHPQFEVQAYGAQAADYSRDKLEGNRVWLEFDRELWDKYNRLLAYVYLDERTSIQEELLKSGLARAYIRFPFLRSSEYLAFESEARDAKLGLWSDDQVAQVLELQQQYLNEEQQVEVEGLTLTVDTPSGVVASGTTVRITPSVSAQLKASIHSGAFLSFSGSLVVAGDTDLAVYAQREAASGAMVQSDTLFLSYVVKRESYQLPLILSEVLSNPQLGDEHDEWIEFYNPTYQPFSLLGWSIDDVLDAGSKPFVFGPDAVVGSGSYYVVYKEQSGLVLNNNQDEIHVLAPNGIRYLSQSIPRLERGQSFVYEQKNCTTDVPTPNNANRCITLNLSKNAPDRDRDFLVDDLETWRTGTDRFNPDSDGDGFLDGFEVLHNLDPLRPEKDIRRTKILYKDFVLNTVKPSSKILKTKGLRIQGKSYPMAQGTVQIPSLAIERELSFKADGSWQIDIPVSIVPGRHRVDLYFIDRAGHSLYLFHVADIVLETAYVPPKKIRKQPTGRRLQSHAAGKKPLSIRYRNVVADELRAPLKHRVSGVFEEIAQLRKHKEEYGTVASQPTQSLDIVAFLLGVSSLVAGLCFRVRAK